ncbi:uncharacterized protein LOC120170648 [Hibiscus syriacus]|uniref:uncharacterized protein LOC120170648 n=1 Tax=Hibiscus syriacus TaxID=106335 RepID=UPI00192452FA|nr:uncharacterized protein LOC120170648 [Hibiscus syriacus]
MATPTTPTTVTLSNQSGDTAMLVSSTYQGVPNVIKSFQTILFQQNTSLNTFGSAMYAMGNIATWVVVWTANNQVATSILPAGTNVIWEEIWSTIRPDKVESSYTTSYGWEYNSEVQISSNGDAQTLTAKISTIPTN